MPATFGRPAAPPGEYLATDAELAAAVAALSSTYLSQGDAAVTYLSQADAATSYRVRAGRDHPAGWSQESDGLSVLQSSGLTTAGDWIAATVGGTDGNAIYPMWGTPAGFRASFTVKATKNTASSKSVVGWTVSAKDSLPSAGSYTFTAGYLQGTGLAIVRENVGAAQVILADASISDGAEYTFGVYYYPPAVAGTSGMFSAMVYDSTGARVGYYSSTVTLANFALNNLLLRTNVAAGGLSDVVLSQHIAGPGLACNTFVESDKFSTGDDVTFWVPPNPNGHVVLALHGHGGTATETGWTSTTYAPTWDALTAAGYAVLVPQMGGNLWGNSTALGHVTTAHTKLVAAGFEPDVFVWGFSMGGGAAATLASDGTVPVRAVYMANPALDYAWVASQGGYTASIGAAYATTALRNASDPMQRAAASFADTAFLVVASSSDTNVSKVSNADAFVSRIAGATEVRAVTSTGVHTDPSSFRAADCVNWFNAHR